MPFDRTAGRLQDIRDAIGHAQQFAVGMSRDQFGDDLLRLYAVTRCLEIISEASRWLEPDFKARHPHLPWREIAAAGNVYRHDYSAVETDIVWATLHEALPPLLAAVEAELAARS